MSPASSLLAAIACFLWMAASCGVRSSVEKNLAASSEKQKEEFSTLLERLENSPSVPIAWKAAYERMMKDGLAMRQSRQQLDDAERQTRRQWLNLAPKVVSYANIGTSISDLTDFASEDVNLRLFTNLNIPNPFQFYGSLYGAALQRQNAIWFHELDKRRAYAQLYSAFIEERSLDETEASIQRRRAALPDGPSSDISKLLKSLASEIDSLERRRQFHRIDVNRLLNTPGGNWKLSGEIPAISYRDRLQRMEIGEDFGKLALNLQAIQIEGALLQLQRVKFQQWPMVNFGMSLPPLYTSDGTSGFSSDDLYLFSGASKSFDLTDISAREAVGDAETRLRFTREQVQHRAESEASRMLQLISNYKRLLGELKRLDRYNGHLEHAVSAEPEIVLKDLALRMENEMRRIEVRRQLEQLDLQFLIWDEKFWKR